MFLHGLLTEQAQTEPDEQTHISTVYNVVSLYLYMSHVSESKILTLQSCRV